MDENTIEEKLETTDTPKKSFPFMAVIAVLAVIAIGISLLTKSSPNQDNKIAVSDDKQPMVAGKETENNEVVQDETTVEVSSGSVEVEGGMFYFKPNIIKVKKGQPIKIVFKNVEGVHDFVVDEFKVQSKKIKADESDTFEFTPDKTGSFEFYCSIGNHREMGMKGTLIVE